MTEQTHQLSRVAGYLAENFDSCDKAIEAVTRWLTKKTKGLELTNQQRMGLAPIQASSADFDVKAFRIEDEGNVFTWMMRFEDPSDTEQGRVWATEIAIRHDSDGKFPFKVSVAYKDSPGVSFAKPVSNIPNVVRLLAQEPGFIIDNLPVMDDPLELDDIDAIKMIAEFVASPERVLPIVLISEDKEGRTFFDPQKILQDLKGVAHVFIAPANLSYSLGQNLSRDLSAFNGSVRVIIPNGIRVPWSGENKNPLFVMHGGHWFPEDAARFAKSYSFQASLLKRNPVEDLFPAFSAFEDSYHASIQDQQTDLEDVVEAEAAIAGHTVDVSEPEISLGDKVEAMLADKDVELQAAFALAEEQSGRADELGRQLALVSKQLEELIVQKSPVILTKGLFPPLEKIGDWAQDLFPRELLITDKAIKGAKQSIYAEPDLIFQCMALLAKDKRAMHLGGENGNRERILREFARNAKHLRVEDGAAISAVGAGQYGEEYYATADGKRFFLERHLSKGNARNPARCLRIYYTFDDESSKVVVGHLPTHLTLGR